MAERHQGLNRHELVRRHKRKMKQKYAVSGWDYCTNLKLLEAKRRAEVEEDDWWIRKHPHRARNGGFTYWDYFDISGRRGFAKKQTSKQIRSHYREMLSHMDPEDIPAYKGSDYEKEFDYNWTIW